MAMLIRELALPLLLWAGLFGAAARRFRVFDELLEIAHVGQLVRLDPGQVRFAADADVLNRLITLGLTHRA